MRPSLTRNTISFLTLLAFGIFQPAQAASDSYHIVIEGGKIVDGKGGPWYYGMWEFEENRHPGLPPNHGFPPRDRERDK